VNFRFTCLTHFIQKLSLAHHAVTQVASIHDGIQSNEGASFGVDPRYSPHWPHSTRESKKRSADHEMHRNQNGFKLSAINRKLKANTKNMT
jgi:hypothetical protein